MKKYFPLIFTLAYILILCQCRDVVAQTPPWILPSFNPVRIVPSSNTLELKAALDSAQSGDLIELADGNYLTDKNLYQEDVMIRCKGHCILTSNGLTMNGPNQWLWGLEIIAAPAVNFFSANGGVVNCVIHGDPSMTSVGIFTVPIVMNPNNKIVFYGNIIYGTKHLIYLQNTLGSPKYVVNNILLEVNDSIGRSIHEYTQSANKGEDIHYVDDVIISSGELLIGGENNATPPIKNTLENLIVYNTPVRLGYKRPYQIEIKNTMFLKSLLFHEFLWGVGEGWYQYAGDTLTTNNVFWNPGLDQISIQTSRYPCNGCTREDGLSKLRSGDQEDNNQFYGGFKATLHADGSSAGYTNISTWRTATGSAGNSFDINSIVNSTAPPDGFKLSINEYDPNRAFLTAWHFAGSQSISITLPQAADLYDVKNTYGAPAVHLPAGSSQLSQAEELKSYLVKFTAEAPGECNPAKVFEMATEIFNVSIDPNLSKDKRIRQMRKIDVELINLCDQ